MKYTEYPGFTKAYVLVHNTGFGVVEAPYKEHGIVFETDDLEEAVSKANELKFQNNTEEEIKSSWYDNSYHINVNTLSEKGKELLEQFSKESEERLQKGLAEGKYNIHKIGDHTLYVDKSMHDFLSEPSVNKLTSSSACILDMSDDNHQFPYRIAWSKPKGD